MNDAVMVALMLTLVFGAVVFYLYNRLSMTERKLGLFEGILTDLKIMMDAAPFASGPPPAMMREFQQFAEPITAEYLNAISGPVPLQENEVEDVEENSADEYQQTLEQAFENVKGGSSSEGSSYRMLQVDELGSSAPVISVTKLSPDLDSMTVKELLSLAKQQGRSIPANTRRKEIIELLKKHVPTLEGAEELLGGVPLGGVPLGGGAPLEPLQESIGEVTL